MKLEKILKVGVCEGRHPLPVNYYIFPQKLFRSVVVMHYDRDSGNYYEQKM